MLIALQDCLRRTVKPKLSRRDLLELDVELHRLIVEASGNELLQSIARSLSVLGRKSRELTVQRPGAVERAVAEHRAIVEAIVGRQVGRAREAMAAHLKGVWKGFDQVDR